MSSSLGPTGVPFPSGFASWLRNQESASDARRQEASEETGQTGQSAERMDFEDGKGYEADSLSQSLEQNGEALSSSDDEGVEPSRSEIGPWNLRRQFSQQGTTLERTYRICQDSVYQGVPSGFQRDSNPEGVTPMEYESGDES